MGQKRKTNKADVLFGLSRMMVPRDLPAFSDIAEIKEHPVNINGTPWSEAGIFFVKCNPSGTK
ncbi:MAG: hypothetical protein QM642_07355, partial [Edaphocola sp.]